MESEAALAKIDAYLGGHGFRSQPVERKTPSGFVAARRWTKPGVGAFSTYTHADGSFGDFLSLHSGESLISLH